MAGNFMEFLNRFINDWAKYNGVNLIYGQYAEQGVVIKGIDENKNDANFGKPKLVFKRLITAGNPIDFTFRKEKDEVRMDYGFEVVTEVANAIPLKISEVEINLHYQNNDGEGRTISLKHALFGAPHQTATGNYNWKKIEEFLAVKDGILNGKAKIFWEGKVKWLDVSSEEMRKNIENQEYKPSPLEEKISGEIDIEVTPDSPSYESAFGMVKHLLYWERIVGSNDEPIYFMDTLKDNTICFLPQEYRVKAMDTNAPEMKISLEKNKDLRGYQAIISFRLAPHILPNAKRMTYELLQSRKGQKYFKLSYGGYNSVKFKWGAEMEGGCLYGPDGFKALTCDDKIGAAPESCFIVTLKSPIDGLVEQFKKLITEKGLVIGGVYFEVQEGEKGEETRALGPIPVKLDLQQLTGFKTEVTILENDNKDIKMPYYQAKVTNTGKYALVVGGAELTVQHWKKNEVRDVRRNLRCTNSWPVTLKPGESVVVSLTNDQINDLKKKKVFFFTDKNYWNELICEPYGLRILDEDIETIVDEYYQDATYEMRDWIVQVGTNFIWEDFPNLIAVWVQIKNQWGVNEEIALSKGETSKILMTPNLNATMKTQDSYSRVFDYRIAVLTKDNPEKSAYGQWATYADDDAFYIKEDDIKELL